MLRRRGEVAALEVERRDVEDRDRDAVLVTDRLGDRERLGRRLDGGVEVAERVVHRTEVREDDAHRVRVVDVGERGAGSFVVLERARELVLGMPARADLQLRPPHLAAVADRLEQRKRLEPERTRALLVSGDERHHARLAEGPRAQLDVLDPRRELDAALEAPAPFLGVATDAPEVAHRHREPELLLERRRPPPRARRRRGCCRAPARRGRAIGVHEAVPVEALALHHREEPREVAVADAPLVTRRGEQLRRVLADGLEHPEARFGGAAHAGDERRVEQVVERGHHVDVAGDGLERRRATRCR